MREAYISSAAECKELQGDSHSRGRKIGAIVIIYHTVQGEVNSGESYCLLIRGVHSRTVHT